VGNRLTVIAWHNVERTWLYRMAPGAGVLGFARQVQLLSRYGTIVPLAESLQALSAGRPLPPRAVALTFDDGYRDNLELALPILEHYRAPATFFLVPHLLDGKVRHIWELLHWAYERATVPEFEWRGETYSMRGRGRARTERLIGPILRALSFEQIEPAIDELIDLLEPAGDPGHVATQFLDGDGAAELVRRGFAIGSHTLRHGILARESPETQRHELAESRLWLERAFEVPVTTLTYPNGRWADFDEATIAAARAAGYTHSLTTQLGVNDPSTPAHAVRRVGLEPQRRFTAMAAQRLVWKVEHKLGRKEA
jgi:peptidoglycan/xylan/chitin deacetylase (PgdA/CDA1 family)